MVKLIFGNKYILFFGVLLMFSHPLPAQDVSSELQNTVHLSAQKITEAWNRVPANVTVGFGTSAVRYAQIVPPEEPVADRWLITGWKNEKVQTQIVIYTKKALKRVSVVPGVLKSDNSAIISGKNISVGFVQYVMTDEFAGGCGYRIPENFDSSEVADMINTDLQTIAVQKNNVQPVWITIKIPARTKAGVYNGFITVKADRIYRLKISLKVLDRSLPSPRDWSFQLDYWQHPAAIARVHHVPLWSDAHFNLMRKYYTLLANAGQKTITASIVDEPWGHQTYDDYPSLVRWTKKKDGSWQYDYHLFDKYITFVMSCGIKDQINCYSMVPWKIAFKYYDESLGRDTVFTNAIGTPAYDHFWRTMLVDFTKHLKEKGWFDKTTIAMDERPMKSMLSVIALLRSVDPAWKISLAGDYHQEIEKDIYDYCIASRWRFPDDVLRKRAQKGQKSTWYTCCTEKYPNEFTFSPPDEATWVGWYTAASNMDGFLRWAYNSWPGNPLKDSRFTAWPAGDTYQVYPGPLSSIRLEKLIEGIQDFEKIKILRKEYKDKNELNKLSSLDAALNKFTIPQLSKETAREMIDKYRPLLN